MSDDETKPPLFGPDEMLHALVVTRGWRGGELAVALVRARSSEAEGIKAAEMAADAFDLAGELASEAQSAAAAYEWGDRLKVARCEDRIKEIRAQMDEALAALCSFLAKAKGEG